MIVWEPMPGLIISNFPKRCTDVPDGVTAVVTLVRREPEASIVQSHDWLHEPMPDGKVTPAVLALCDRVVPWVEERIANGGTVLVHCMAGRNRSALIAGLILVRNEPGWSGLDAWDHITQLRPNALHNPHFAEYLRALPERVAA
jgi:protein-tyrosine phosphatase